MDIWRGSAPPPKDERISQIHPKKKQAETFEEEHPGKAPPMHVDEYRVFTSTIRPLVSYMEDVIKHSYLEMEERSKLNLAIWKMAEDPRFAARLLPEIAFFSKERLKKNQRMKPLVERVQALKAEELLTGLRRALEVESVNKKQLEETRRMDEAA